MSRPEQVPLDASSAGWVDRFNANAAKVLDGPLPLGEFASVVALTSAHHPALNEDCMAVVGGRMYRSNGTDWVQYPELLTFIADLDTGTATVDDVKTAYNALIADMQAKGMML